MNILIDRETANRYVTKAEEIRMVNSSEAIMRCGDYSEEDSRCNRGIHVAPLFGHYFCTGNHEHCPLRLWGQTLPEPANVVRPREPYTIRRR